MNDKSWAEVFLTLNASVNNYSMDTVYLKALAEQIANKTETKLESTSRLIIWDRITSGDIIFEGKGLVIDNDLFQVGGRANQVLQNLTNKNFGFVTIYSTSKDLEELKNKWLDFLSNKHVERCQKKKDRQLISVTLTPIHTRIWDFCLEIKSLTNPRMPNGGKTSGIVNMISLCAMMRAGFMR